SALSATARDRVAARILYDGSTLPVKRMADFYRAADAYVSPYRAEGFNLPVLEAAACGLPLICTKGGPTDEFTDDGFALYIDSKAAPSPQGNIWLEPDLDHLIAHMLEIIDAETWRSEAARKGPDAAKKLDWDFVAAGMVDAIFGEAER